MELKRRSSKCRREMQLLTGTQPLPPPPLPPPPPPLVPFDLQRSVPKLARHSPPTLLTPSACAESALRPTNTDCDSSRTRCAPRRDATYGGILLKDQHQRLHKEITAGILK